MIGEGKDVRKRKRRRHGPCIRYTVSPSHKASPASWPSRACSPRSTCFWRWRLFLERGLLPWRVSTVSIRERQGESTSRRGEQVVGGGRLAGHQIITVLPERMGMMYLFTLLADHLVECRELWMRGYSLICRVLERSYLHPSLITLECLRGQCKSRPDLRFDALRRLPYRDTQLDPVQSVMSSTAAEPSGHAEM